MTKTVIIFNSTLHPESDEEGYTVELIMEGDGESISVQFVDYEVGAVVEVPPKIALLMAKAIEQNVRDPESTLQ